MCRRFLLALFTLAALLLLLHARADRSGADSEPGPLRVIIRARALLQHPEPQKNIAEPPVTVDRDDVDGEARENEAEAPTEIGEMERHHSADKSVAGGGVIIGGLVTAIFAAVYCYIRVTRRRHAENLG
ncbi:hypothetical protein CASFOL_008137 [Castilleja foliolosa]|uniref:Uncharacterized protein n=1 Tax=Castilleja foliolosa TaxID=1961234 RepID=A0ABD3E2A2_9LAMI